jgi:hypothetical protein
MRKVPPGIQTIPSGDGPGGFSRTTAGGFSATAGAGFTAAGLATVGAGPASGFPEQPAMINEGMARIKALIERNNKAKRFIDPGLRVDKCISPAD